MIFFNIRRQLSGPFERWEGVGCQNQNQMQVVAGVLGKQSHTVKHWAKNVVGDMHTNRCKQPLRVVEGSL